MVPLKNKQHCLKRERLRRTFLGVLKALARSPKKIPDKCIRCAKLHPCSFTPTQKPRQGKLSKAERQPNRPLARSRVVTEPVKRKLKIFRILAERYRNRRKRFGLRFNRIAAIINFELALSS